MRNSLIVKTTILLALSNLHSIANGATWLGNNASYTTGAEWDIGFVPATNDPVDITTGVATNVGNLTRNGATTISGTGSLVISAGRFVSGGLVTVSESGKLDVTGNYFLVGNQSQGTVNQLGGSISATLDRGFFLSDNANGAGSKYNLFSGTLSVISNGTGANQELYAVHIGKGGVGDAFTIDGGSASFTATVPSRNVWLSRQSLFDLESGSVLFSGYESFTIGQFGAAGATSMLQINGGTFEVKSALNPFTLGFTENGSVSLAAGIMRIEQSIVLGGGSTGASGSFFMSGGQLFAADILPGAGVPSFTFTGGDMFLSGDRTGIVSEPWFQAPAGVTAIYDVAANQTHVSVVPEPSAGVLLWISAVALLGRRRRA